MTYLKRELAPKKWPVERKGLKYLVKPLTKIDNSIPILILLRDILKIAQNRDEVKKAINKKNILINQKPITNEKRGVFLFDIITIIPMKKNYKLTLDEKGKFLLEEIKESEAVYKISKIIGKKVLNGKKKQLNMMDGFNFLTDIKCKINDSVIINLKSRKIEKCIELKEKENVVVFAGKHSGQRGTIEKIDSEKKMIELKTKNQKINALIKQIIAVE